MNEYRYYYAKQLKSISLNLFPPTEGALKKHVERVYLQCQIWHRRNMNPCEWGWRKNKQENILEPIFSDEAMIPENILKNLTCSCKTNCANRCGCRKLGLKCNKFCKICKGNECLNSEIIEDLASAEISTAAPEIIELEVEPFVLIDVEQDDEFDCSDYDDINEDLNDEPPAKMFKM